MTLPPWASGRIPQTRDHPLQTVLADDLHTLTLPYSDTATVSGTTNHAFEGTIASAPNICTQPKPLSQNEIDSIAQKLAGEFPEVGKDALAAMLSVFGSEEVVRYFLKFVQEMGLTNRSDIVAIFKKFLEFATDKATGGTFRWAEAIVAIFYSHIPHS